MRVLIVIAILSFAADSVQVKERVQQQMMIEYLNKMDSILIKIDTTKTKTPWNF